MLFSEVRVAASPIPTVGAEPRLTVSYPAHGECVDHRAYLRGFVGGLAGAGDGRLASLRVDGEAVAGGVAADGAFGVLIGEGHGGQRAGQPWRANLDVATPDAGLVCGGPPRSLHGRTAGAGGREARRNAGRRRALRSGRPGRAAGEDCLCRCHAGDPRRRARARRAHHGASAGGGRCRAHGLDDGQRHAGQPWVPLRPARHPVQETGSPDAAVCAAPAAGGHDRGRRAGRSSTTRTPGTGGPSAAWPRHTGAPSPAPAITSPTSSTRRCRRRNIRARSRNPTSLKDIKLADPAGLDSIQPPGASPSGAAQLTYPITVPPGRAGIAPSLQVGYNSEAGDGWMGMGWDVSLSHITVDTRFGVPRYGSGTELYVFDGAELAPVDTPAGETGQRFRRRVEGSFARIRRLGDGPTNYHWEVTEQARHHLLLRRGRGRPAGQLPHGRHRALAGPAGRRRLRQPDDVHVRPRLKPQRRAGRAVGGHLSGPD